MEIDLGKEWEGYVGDCQNSFEKDDYFTTQALVQAGSSGTVVELLEQAWTISRFEDWNLSSKIVADCGSNEVRQLLYAQ